MTASRVSALRCEWFPSERLVFFVPVSSWSNNVWSHSYLKYLKTPFCWSFPVIHGPLTASNLLVTWRRHRGDAKITCGSEIMRFETNQKKTQDGARWGSKFLCPEKMRQQHLPGRTEESGMDGEENKNHNDINHFFLPQHCRKHPLSPSSHPPKMLWHLLLLHAKGIFPSCSGFGVCVVFVCLL